MIILNLNLGDLARRLGEVVGRGGDGRRRARVSADDVLARLGPRPTTTELALALEVDSRALDEIDGLLSTLPRVVADARLPRRHPGFVRYFEALPRIVFLRGRGHSSAEIAGQLNFLATAYGVEAVLGIVAETVAKRLSHA
jgi:hypothetical protein